MYKRVNYTAIKFELKTTQFGTNSPCMYPVSFITGCLDLFVSQKRLKELGIWCDGVIRDSVPLRCLNSRLVQSPNQHQIDSNKIKVYIDGSSSYREVLEKDKEVASELEEVVNNVMNPYKKLEVKDECVLIFTPNK